MKPRKVPKLCRHKASGLGYVTDPDTHRPIYLGKWHSPECLAAYDRWRVEFLRRTPGLAPALAGAQALTVEQLAAAYGAHATGYYVKRGKPTGHLRAVKMALRYLRPYGGLAAGSFMPAQLKECREAMVAAGLARKTANALVSKLRAVWKWGVEEGLVHVSAYQALCAVKGLAKGRTAAPDYPRVPPVPEADFEAVLRHLRPKAASILRLCRWAGMRPGEACLLRAADIDRTATPWVFRPGEHKTEHHDAERTVYFGPKCRGLLQPLLDRARTPAAYLFTARSGGPYRVTTLAWLVRRACERAGVPHWSPRQLRHSAATEIRKRYGIEAVQAALGHSEIKTSQVYADRLEELARRAAEDLG